MSGRTGGKNWKIELNKELRGRTEGKLNKELRGRTERKNCVGELKESERKRNITSFLIRNNADLCVGELNEIERKI